MTLGQRDLLISAALIAFVAAVFSSVARHDFVQYDDPLLVTDNPHVKAGLTWDGIVWAFGRGANVAYWMPLTYLSHMIDVQVFGMRAGPAHVVNVVLHAINTALLYLLLRWMTGAVWSSAFVAVMFGVHPLHVESVAWIAERKDVLSGLFFLLTIAAHAWYVQKPSWRRYACVLAAFLLALMSKPIVVTLPAVLLLLDTWPLKRPRRWGLVVEKVPLVGLAIAVSIVTVIAQQNAGAMRSLDQFPLSYRLTNAIVSYARYIGKTFWPTNLAVFYPAPPQWPATIVIASAVVLVVITIIAIWQAKRRPYLIIGWLWFLGTMLPVIGIIQVGRQSMADRYSYLPHIGLFIMLAWLAAEAGPRWRGALAALAIVGTLAASLRSIDQLRHWRNNKTLFEHALAVTTDNPVANLQVGNIRFRERNFLDAERHYREALRIEESYALAHMNLAHLLVRRGQYDEAIAHYERALELNPNLQKAQEGLNEARRRR